MKWVIGIDVGGTNCVVGAVAVDGSRVVGNHTRPTRVERGADGIIAELIVMAMESVAAVRAEDASAEILGVGVGSPGPLSVSRGVVINAANMRWTDVSLRGGLADGLGLAAALDNDARCAVLAECWIGAAQQGKCVIGLTLGTGIGGGIVIDGKLSHGVSDVAGEFGHMVINFDGPLCSCGNHGCLEAYASGTNIARRAREMMASGDATMLRDMTDGDPARVTAMAVYDAANAGDVLAQRVAADTARYLGIGVANLVNIFNPDTVVILGGVIHAGDALFAPLRREVAARAFKTSVDACRIVPGKLEGLAGVYGAARAFIDQRAAGLV